MPTKLVITSPLSDADKAQVRAYIGDVSTGSTGSTTPPAVDNFPADPALAPFPSPENSQVVNTGGTIGGRPYLKDSDGTVHTLKVVAGVVYWQKGNSVWPGTASEATSGPVNQLLVRQGKVFGQWGSIWKDWTSVSVYNASLPPASGGTTGGGGTGTPSLPAMPPNPAPADHAPGSSGVVIKAGPSQTLKTLREAIAAASDGDKIQLDNAIYTEMPPVWSKSLLIDLGGGTFDATGQTATLAYGKGVMVPLADSIIQNGTITGAAMDQGAGELTCAIRPDGGCGYLTIRNMQIHGNQCGVGCGELSCVITIEDSDLSGNGLKVNSGSLTHNLYVGVIVRLILKNVISTDPVEAHAIKFRGHDLIVNGGTFASSPGKPFDLSNGTTKPFSITGATIIKKADDPDHGVLAYAAEGTENGLAGGTINGGSISAFCDHPEIRGPGGTITAVGVAFSGSPVVGSGGVTLSGF